MKKIYTFLTWMIAAMIFAPVLSAKTITLTIDDPAAAYYIDVNNYGQQCPWDGTSVEYTSANDVTIPVQANDGYTIMKVEGNGNTFMEGPNSSAYIPMAAFSDGGEVTITTAVLEPLALKIVANPDHVYIVDEDNKEHNASDNVDGAWTLTGIHNYGTTKIHAKEGYLITEAGTENFSFASSPTTYCSIDHFPLGSGLQTVTVKTVNEADLYDGSVRVKVHGSPYIVSFRFNGHYSPEELADDGVEKTFTFSRSNDMPIHIKHLYDSSYSPQSLYKVTVNGTALTAVDREYLLNSEDVSNDDLIEIYVNPPIADVNVSVNFADELSKKALLSLRYDYDLVSPDKYSSFTATTGKSLQFEFATQDYDITLTENGVAVPVEYSNVNCTILEDQDYNYLITATEKKPYTVTVICENYEHLIMSPNYSGDDAYELTGEETKLTILPSQTFTFFKPKEGWKIAGLSDAISGNTLTSPLNLTDGMQIFVELEEYKRDKQCTVYLDNYNWSYIQFVLNRSDDDLQKQIDLEKGYQTVNFNDADRPFFISGNDQNYSSPDIYVNGKKCIDNYGSYEEMNDIQDGDVIKIMQSSTPIHTISYAVDPNVNVKIVHDRTMAVDHGASQEAHVGTEIHIIPLAPMSRAASAGVIVTAGDQELEPDEDGKFVHIVTAPVEIAVKADNTTSISDIEAAADGAVDVYNLQGVCVRKAATAADINTLPAGIYVTTTGKKVVVK